MNIIVTGGAGFIGCNAAHELAKKGHDVVVVDNLSRRGSATNLDWLRRVSPKVAFEHLELRDGSSVESFFRRRTADAVLHCAAQVAVTTSVTDPRRDFEDNALGTFNLLEGVRKSGRKPLVLYTSTNKVYGGMEDVVVELAGERYRYRDLPRGVDEARGLDFHSPYGCSKGAADQYVHDYHRIYGIPTVVFRQSCIYGQRQFGVEDQGWVAWFTIAASLGKPITLYGDGKQVRDVLHIDDLVRLYESAIAQPDKSAGQIFNIGGGPENQLSLLELLAELEALTGQKIPVGKADWRPGDQRVFVCNIDKAKRVLGWEPKLSPREGVRKLHGWVREHLEEIRVALG